MKKIELNGTYSITELKKIIENNKKKPTYNDPLFNATKNFIDILLKQENVPQEAIDALITKLRNYKEK